jgi:type IV pilus assembly protein PilE
MTIRHAVAGHRGFSLIELVTAMAIVGILAAIAIPAYSSYVRQTNRTDATRTMLQDAQALQRCYSQNFTYTPTTPCSTVAGTTTSPGGYYSIVVAVPTASTYTITATAAARPQTSDTQCKTFVLSSTGQQTAQNSSGADNTQTCWGSH